MANGFAARLMTLFGDIRGLRSTVWILFVGTLINRFGGFVLFFLVLYFRSKGYSAAKAGVGLSIYGVGAVCAALAGGYLADRLGRRNTIALSMFGSAATLLAMAQVQAFAGLIALAALAGFTSELYRPAAAALLTDVTVPEQRVTVFAIYRLAINLGVAIGPAVGGFLADRSFVLLFVTDAITSIVFGLIALFALPNPRVEHAQTEDKRSAMRIIASDRSFLYFLIASLLGAALYTQAHAGLPLHVKALGLSNSVFGILMSVNGLIVLLFELPLTQFTKHRDAFRVIAFGMFLTGVGFGLTGFGATVPLLVATVAVWTFGEIVFVPVAGAHVANIAPAHMRGRYQGAWMLTWGLAAVMSPVAGTVAFAAAPWLLWGGCFTLGLLAVCFVGLARRAYHIASTTAE